MSISLTLAAAERIKDQLATRGQGVGLRLGVKAAGCSGFSYVIDFADKVAENDQVFESHGVKVVVDNESIDFLDGTSVDFRKEGLGEAFQFDNPKVNAMCGCGESFTV